MFEGLTPPYATIVADPPWPIGWSGGAGGRRRRAVPFAYSTLPLDDIRALPVDLLCAPEGSHLYLWITAGLHRSGESLRVLEAWGFEFVGEIVWAKPNFGMGAFPRPAHELLIVGREKGCKVPFCRNDVASVQTWSTPRGHNNGGKVHSAKPAAAYDLIESASPGPYVDLFARQQRLGWDSWGYGYEPVKAGAEVENSE